MLIDVDQIELCTNLGDGFRRCDERVRHRHHGVAGFHTRSDQGEPQRIGAPSNADTVPRVTKRSELALEVLNHRAANESSRAEGGAKKRHQFLFELPMRSDQIEEGNPFAGLHRATPASSALDRNTRAAFPATIALPGTLRVTTLPAPIRAFSPIVILARMVAPEPIDAPARTSVGSTFQSFSVCNAPLGVVARGYESLMNVTPWPTKTLSSMVTPSQMNVWLEILQFLPILAFFWISTKAPILVLSPTSQP